MSRLKTARVPEPFEDEFAKAEQVVSRYFEQRIEDPAVDVVRMGVGQKGIVGEQHVPRLSGLAPDKGAAGLLLKTERLDLFDQAKVVQDRHHARQKRLSHPVPSSRLFFNEEHRVPLHRQVGRSRGSCRTAADYTHVIGLAVPVRARVHLSSPSRTTHAQ